MAAAAGAEECRFFDFYSRDSEVTLDIFAVHFWTSFRHEIRWCFGVARGCGEGLKAEAWSLAVAAAAGEEEEFRTLVEILFLKVSHRFLCQDVS